MTEPLFEFPTVEPEPQVSKSKLVGALGALVLVLGILIGVVGAWPSPDASGYGGACEVSDGTRGPVIWTVVNKETGYDGSPATITNVKVTNDFPTTSFKPQPLPNTGSASATAITNVPPEFSGTVKLTFTMVWSGTDGTDSRDGSASVLMIKCEPPVTTTTSTTSTSTTTSSTTTTTEPTTTTTKPTTTTTSSTTTTTQPTTTTTKPTTTTSSTTTSTSTSTTVPSTTSTVPSTSTSSTTTTEPSTTTSSSTTSTVPPSTTTTVPPPVVTTVPPVTGSVSPTPSGGSLPVTGAQSTGLVIFGLVLVAIGVVLLVASRKNKA